MKTKLAFTIATLVMLSAIITDVLVVVVVQNLIVRQQVEHDQRLLESIGRTVVADSDGGKEKSFHSTPYLSRLIEATRMATIQVNGPDGGIYYQKESAGYPVSLIAKAIGGLGPPLQATVKNIGWIWAGFWRHPQAVIISIPIKAESKLIGIASGVSVLSPVYQKVARFNKPILFYIIINTVILTVVGLYRIITLYLRPIDRIVRQADDYQEDDDLFFAFRQEDNQLNRLSSALNRMLNRIKADKETLQKTVISLEQANRALKNAQKKIIQAEKMASVGRLASGIAHEIGNPIGIVLGYLDLLKKSDSRSDEDQDCLKRTEEEVQRINTIIRQLLDLARPKDTEYQLVDLNGVVEEITAVMRMQPVVAHIQFNVHLDQGHFKVWANADQLRQVFLNLLLNAADAIQSRESSSDNGCITIQSTCLESHDDGVPERIQIRFEDNGIGIEPEAVDNIFDPFYTTKEPGKGTGLGLAVSYMIIEGLGGSLFAESKPGEGSAFIIELPVANGAYEQVIGNR